MYEYTALIRALGDDESLEAARSRAERREATAEPDPAADDEPALQWGPELRLMLAILDDAVACYTKSLRRPRQNPDLLARQAEFWIRLDDWESPFSFNNVCEALRLDPIATRERILRKRPGVRRSGV
jgi:hypothetical protein